MNKVNKGWLFFSVLLVLLLLGGYLAGRGRSREPGPELRYDLSEQREASNVEPLYVESAALKFDLGLLSALCIADEKLYVAGETGLVVSDLAGAEQTRFSIPAKVTGLDVAENGTIYAGIHDRIAVLGAQTVEWPTLGDKAWITSIAVGEDVLYAADAGNRLVWKLDLQGKVQARLTEKNVEAGIPGLFVPSPFLDLALEDENSLWVVNPGKHSFENYRPDGSLITSWRKSSMSLEGFSGCCNPTHFVLLPNGDFVTSEKGLPRVKILGPDGEFVGLVAGPDAFADGITGLDLAADAAGRIYVLDPVAATVRIFEREKP